MAARPRRLGLDPASRANHAHEQRPVAFRNVIAFLLLTEPGAGAFGLKGSEIRDRIQILFQVGVAVAVAVLTVVRRIVRVQDDISSMVPPTRKTIARGPFVSIAARKLPGIGHLPRA